MGDTNTNALSEIITRHEEEILAGWLDYLAHTKRAGVGQVADNELRIQCRDFLSAFLAAYRSGETDSRGAAFQRVRDMLGDISRYRAVQGFTSTETATFVFSLKEPIVDLLQRHDLQKAAWPLGSLIDQLGLYSMEVFQKSREEVILRQQQEIAELSTPVVKLWDGILALPLIGTLDSTRTQVVMENLLQSIVQEGAEIAIIDITGVPTVDTLVAQHLLKTVAATRLMGADCIISGIRPQIAQTMVHLGVELNVVSKASLADAFGMALQRVGKQVVRIRSATRFDGNGGQSGSLADRD
ncbi:MAG TPA: STAS domain-containing protein [Terriglobia bacterium]|nr:STAS domain-containing protein [Terriglobia bacterium]